MKKLSILVAAIILILPSCQQSEKFTYKGEKGGTLIVSLTNEPTTLNPLYPSLSGLSAVTEKLFTPLLERRPDNKVRPGLAQSWVYSEDLQSITYTIRKGAKWHDGNPVTAEDIVFTVNQIKKPENNSPLAQQLRYVESAEVVSPNKVKFNLSKVYADELLHTNIYPIPEHRINKEVENLQMSDFSFEPVGNGPYKLNEWQQGKWIELIANPDYFRGRPPLDRIVYYFPSSKEELMDEIELGNINIAYDLPPAQYDTVENYNTIVSPGRSYTYIGWNLEKFSDPELRKAFTMAINREGIINDILKGYGRILNGPITPEHWAFNPNLKGIEYNREEAIKSIEELGYSKRSWQSYYPNLRIEILIESGNQTRKNVAEHIESDLQNAGINAEITELRSSQLINRLFSGNFDAYILGWNVEKAFNPLPIWSSAGVYNFINYNNKKVDNLINRALLSLDREKAKEAWFEFQRIIAKDQPYTFLYSPQKITLVKENVGGINEGESRPVMSFVDELWLEEKPESPIELAVLGTHYSESQEEGTETEEEQPQQTSGSTEEMLQAAAPITVPETEEESPEVDTTAVTGGQTEETTEEDTIQEPAGPVIPPSLSYYPQKRDYPANARKLEISGQVFIKVHITEEGMVDEADIVKGIFPSCDSAALRDAYKCRFDPATQGGQPVDYTQTLPFRFPPEGW